MIRRTNRSHPAPRFHVIAITPTRNPERVVAKVIAVDAVERDASGYAAFLAGRGQKSIVVRAHVSPDSLIERVGGTAILSAAGRALV